MGVCHLCNDFEPGDGQAYLIKTWISKLLSSPCCYCKLFVQAIDKLEPEFLARLCRQEYDVRGDGRPGVTFRVRAMYHGMIAVVSSFDKMSRLVLVFFVTAPGNADTGETDTLLLPVRGEIAEMPGDAAMWTFLRTSLETCLREHSDCSKQQDITWFPERLLFIQHNGGGERDKMRLIDTRYEHPLSAYIALSHCWGNAQPVRTTSQNIQSHRDDIGWSFLARTFQDTITVAREMGVSYVWIDSLCIVQDDEEDWARNSEQMDKIYQNALFVVSAVSSSSGHEPFLGPDALTRRHDYCAVELDFTDQNGAHGHDFKRCPKARRFCNELYSTVVMGPLEQRAWTFQERVCATRLMNFTFEEAKWSCKSGASCECSGKFESGRSANFLHWEQQEDAHDKEKVLSRWRGVVRVYSQRHLTYPDDRLPALAGIASRFHTLLKSRYIAGIWETELPFALGWHRAPWNPLRLMGGGAPTWSWATVQGYCGWLWDLHYSTSDSAELPPDIKMHSTVEIVQVDCSPRTSNMFGAVHPGSHLKLRGRVVEATMESDIHGVACVRREGLGQELVLLDCQIMSTSELSGSKKHAHVRRDSILAPIDGSVDHSATDNAAWNMATRFHGIVYCLLLYTVSCQAETRPCVLILGKVFKSGNTCYERLGIGCSQLSGRSGTMMLDMKEPILRREEWDDFGLWEQWEKWFEDVEPETIIVV